MLCNADFSLQLKHLKDARSLNSSGLQLSSAAKHVVSGFSSRSAVIIPAVMTKSITVDPTSLPTLQSQMFKYFGSFVIAAVVVIFAV